MHHLASRHMATWNMHLETSRNKVVVVLARKTG